MEGLCNFEFTTFWAKTSVDSLSNSTSDQSWHTVLEDELTSHGLTPKVFDVVKGTPPIFHKSILLGETSCNLLGNMVSFWSSINVISSPPQKKTPQQQVKAPLVSPLTFFCPLSQICNLTGISGAVGKYHETWGFFDVFFFCTCLDLHQPEVQRDASFTWNWMVGSWKMKIPFGKAYFQGYVSFKEGSGGRMGLRAEAWAEASRMKFFFCNHKPSNCL